jgi:tetratricopeptide (TPR) repeat protein
MASRRSRSRTTNAAGSRTARGAGRSPSNDQRPTWSFARIPGGAVLCLVLALSFAIYAPALRAELVSDDNLAITANELVTGPLDPVKIFTTFSWFGATRADAPGYRPLVTLSFAVDRAISGLDATWLHLVNIVLHVFVSWLVFLLALEIGLDRTEALIASVAFCLLPIHSEAVIWPVGRAELMAAAGFAGALLLVLRYRRNGAPVTLAAAALAFVAGLFSKENAVTLLAAPPLAALLLPGGPQARRRDAVAAGVLLAALGCYVAMRASAGDVVGSAAGDRLDNPLTALSTPSRLVAAVSVLGRYLTLTVWPHPLSVDYSFDALAIGPGFRGDAYVAFALVVCATVAVWAWRQRIERPGVTFAAGIAAATYSIVSNVALVIGTAMAERLFYLPTVGLCLAASPLLARGARAARARGAYVLCAVALACGAVVFARAREWRTPVALFEAATRAYPRSARAQMELGTAYGHVGRADDAVTAFRRATEVMPEYAAAWYNLGNLYARRGAFDTAIESYRTALAHAPRLAAARFNMALALLSSGHSAEAVEELKTAAVTAPGDPEIAMTLGDAYLASGRNAEAAEAYGRVLQIEPRALVARMNRGVALERSSGCNAAIDDYLAVVDAQPRNSTAIGNAVACLRKLGREADAQRLMASGRVANQGDGR